MPQMFARSDIVETLKAALPLEPLVLAAWEGGSAATHGADELSDVDLQLLCDDHQVAAVFAAVENILAGMGGVKHVWHVPEPAWHGHSQRFYSLNNAAPVHLVDLCVMKRSSTSRFLEPERHGRAVVYFDRTGTIRPAAFDRRGHATQMAARLASIRASFPIFQPFVAKEVERGHPIDAMAFYQSQTIRPLIEVLGMKHRPDRYDFMMRYLHLDLPDGIAAQVTQLLYVRDTDDLLKKQQQAVELFEETLRGI